MAGGPGQPERLHEYSSETSKYLSFLNHIRDVFRGYSKSSEDRYIPRSALVQYFTTGGGSLDSLLRENLEQEEHTPQIDILLQQYLAVFSILLSIGKGKYLNRCVERGYSDGKLPFFDKPRHFPKSDDGSLFDSFFDAQWRFCPARLAKYPINFQIEPEQILPLKRRDQISSNASSVTYLVELHEEYDSFAEEALISGSSLDDGKPANHTYLFKEYNEKFRAMYDKELTGFLYLQKSGLLLGKSVTAFYGSFIHGETYTIVLEHSDRGNLDAFMSRVPPPTDGEGISRVWESLLKLHETLHAIHTIDAPQSAEVKIQTLLRGWHQSLCPQNIMVVSGKTESDYDCHFRLANIGTSEEIEGARSYAAPECLNAPPYINMQMADVFSLGCILSEFAVWISSGLAGLNDYRSDRKREAVVHGTQNMDAFHDGHNLLQAVAFWNNTAVENKAVEDKITEALMHQVVEEMLCEDGDARPTTRQLKVKINKILVRAREQRAADLHRQHSVASNSTGYSSAGRSSKSRLSHWNSVRSDSSGGDTPLGNRIDPRDYLRGSGTATSNVTQLMPASAIDEDKEAYYFESANALQTMSPFSPIDSSKSRSTEKHGPAVDSRNVPEPLSFRAENRALRLSGTNMAALLNGDDKEIVVIREPRLTPLRTPASLRPELETETQSTPRTTLPSGPEHHIKQTAASFHDRSAMVTGALEDAPVPISTEIRPDHDPRAANPLPTSTSSCSTLSKSQTTASDISTQSQANVPVVSYLPRSPSLMTDTRLDNTQNMLKPETYQPSLDLIDGLLWLNNKKGSASSATLRDESYLSQVADRDFIFLIDDSGSMRVHREMTSRCVRLMAWLLKKHDKNGMDLYFMSKPGRTHTRPGHSSDLQRPILKALDECTGVHNVDTRLAQILGEYRGRSASGSGLQTGGRSSFASMNTRVVTGTRKIMIYVISNGNWESGSEEQLVNTIDAVGTVLSTQGAPDKAVGIQFIRTTEQNKGRFEKLRTGRRKMEAKIVVDTTDLESNVFRSLLGPIVDLWDDEEAP